MKYINNFLRRIKIYIRDTGIERESRGKKINEKVPYQSHNVWLREKLVKSYFFWSEYRRTASCIIAVKNYTAKKSNNNNKRSIFDRICSAYPLKPFTRSLLEEPSTMRRWS